MKKRTLLLTLSALLLLLVVAYLGAGYLIYNQLSIIMPGGSENAPNTPADFKVRWGAWQAFDTAPYQVPTYENVRIPSRQAGITLAGWYLAGDPAAPAVVVTHGFSSCKCDAVVLVPAGMLHRNGFNVLLYDMRNHGQSDIDNGRTAIGNKEYQDVLGAWDWLVQQKGFAPQRTGLYGVSLGGGTTLIAFAQEPRVPAAFVDSPYSNLPQIMDEELARNRYPTFLAPGAIFMARLVSGVDLLAHSPQDAIRNAAGRPISIVHGTGDQRIGVHHTRQLAALARQTGANVTTWMPEGVGHVEAAYQFSAEYEQRLVAFFNAALKRSGN